VLARRLQALGLIADLSALRSLEGELTKRCGPAAQEPVLRAACADVTVTCEMPRRRYA
jgi:hypothetical protein